MQPPACSHHLTTTPYATFLYYPHQDALKLKGYSATVEALGITFSAGTNSCCSGTNSHSGFFRQQLLFFRPPHLLLFLLPPRSYLPEMTGAQWGNGNNPILTARNQLTRKFLSVLRRSAAFFPPMLPFLYFCIFLYFCFCVFLYFCFCIFLFFLFFLYLYFFFSNLGLFTYCLSLVYEI